MPFVYTFTMAILTPFEELEYIKSFKSLAQNAPFQTIRAILLSIPPEERTIRKLKHLITDHNTLKEDTVLTIIGALYPETHLPKQNPAGTGRNFLNMKVTGQQQSVSAFFQAVEQWQPPQPQETPIEKSAAPETWWGKIMRVLGQQ